MMLSDEEIILNKFHFNRHFQIFIFLFQIAKAVFDMKFFFLIAVLMVLPFVSASDLRSGSGKGWKFNLAQKTIPKKPAKVGTMTYVGPIPTSPIYSSINYYEAGCGTALTAVENTLTGVCFSDGTTSQLYTCGGFYSASYS
jgi:hypothetical protein